MTEIKDNLEKKSRKNPQRNLGDFAIKGSGKKGGRPKGLKNRISKEVVENVLDTLKKLESESKRKNAGVGYLETIAKKDPRVFLSLVARTMPKDIEISGEIEHTVHQWANWSKTIHGSDNPK